jgi:hypothetical protein
MTLLDLFRDDHVFPHHLGPSMHTAPNESSISEISLSARRARYPSGVSVISIPLYDNISENHISSLLFSPKSVYDFHHLRLPEEQTIQQSRCRIALSGGSLPASVYRRAATKEIYARDPRCRCDHMRHSMTADDRKSDVPALFRTKEFYIEASQCAPIR